MYYDFSCVTSVFKEGYKLLLSNFIALHMTVLILWLFFDIAILKL